MINELDLDLKFVFEELTTNINFLDINLKIVDNHLHFDIYLSPFDTKNKILLLLVRHMIRIAIESRGFRLDEKKPSKESNKLFIYKAISIKKIISKKAKKSLHLQEHETQVIILTTTVLIFVWPIFRILRNI